MLHVVTGLFHPELEQSLAADLRSLKADRPLSPCLILVPSESLRTYLKWTLCVERGQPLFNVQVLTFHQLVLRVLEERGRHSSSRLRSGAFFREWVLHLLRKQGEDPVGLEGLASMPGACAALWSTLNDFKNARVDPESMTEAISHGQFSEDRRLPSIIRLYRAFLDVRNECSWYDHEDLAVLALDLVPDSLFLRQQARVLYYGFYDLTQVQLDMFRAVVRQYPTTLYFPLLDKHPAFRFAQQFFDQHIFGLAAGSIERRVEAVHRSPFRSLFDPSGEFGTSQATPRTDTAKDERRGRVSESHDGHPGNGVGAARRVCRLITVSGARDEIEAVAKEIRAVVQEQQVPFRDIGVVGRTMAGSADLISRTFHEQGIPFHSRLHRPLMQYPFPKIFLSLLRLRQSNLDRQTIFDVLHSPFLHWKGFCPEVRTPRPELWEQAARELGVAKGMHEWERLDPYVETGLMLTGRRRRADTVIRGRDIHNLRRVIRRLDQRLQEFPEEASWDVFADRTASLMDAAFAGGERNAGTLTPAAFDEGERGSESFRVTQAVKECVTEIGNLAQTGETIAYTGFLDALNRVMAERSVPLHPTMKNGVWVGDAMAARGLSFRFLFVIGLTDHVFPRHVQEDAFLRDAVRRVLESDLGFKIEEKARGYDEEQLLFFLLVHAARDQITLVTQRSDEEGRATIPSWYLQEVQRCLPGLAPMDVSRSMLQKSQTDAYAVESRWTPRERLIRNLLQRRVPDPSTEAPHEWRRILQKGMETLHKRESDGRLNAYDGITGHLTEYWEWLCGHGLSPTSLEHYARCPFQYFARDVLALRSADEAETTEDVQPLKIGELVHEIVKDWYTRLSEQGWFRRPDSFDVPRRLLMETAESVFREFERTHHVGPALLWEMQRERLLGILERILRQDVSEMGEAWIPLTFERRLDGTMTVNAAGAVTTFPMTGQLDRVDWSPATRRYRVIDYKYTARTTGLLTEKGLAREVVRGIRLQPIMYMELAGQGVPPLLPDEHESEADPATCDGVWLYFVAPGALEEDEGFAPVPFSSDTRNRLRTQLDRTMTTIVEGIRLGKFFFVKGDHCTWCEVRSVCHRNHQESARRAREDAEQTGGHRTLRRRKVD